MLVPTILLQAYDTHKKHKAQTRHDQNHTKPAGDPDEAHTQSTVGL